MINQSFCSLSVPDWIMIPPILLLVSICIQASTLASPSIYNYPSHYSSGLFYDNIYWSDILRLVILLLWVYLLYPNLIPYYLLSGVMELRSSQNPSSFARHNHPHIVGSMVDSMTWSFLYRNRFFCKLLYALPAHMCDTVPWNVPLKTTCVRASSDPISLFLL